MRALLLVLLAACGSPSPVVLAPNTQTACVRAVRCGVFAEHEMSACVACLEHIDQALLAELRESYEIPPLESVDCQTIEWVCNQATNVAQCVREKWWGA